MSAQLELPDYKEQSPEVRDRFDRLYQRPVVLEIDRLHKDFVSPQGETIAALRDINFQIHRREFVCIIGPSGCGKSTLNRIVAGLEEPSAGQVLVDGKPVVGPGPDRGMVFQSYTLFPWLTVKKNVMFGPKMGGAGPRRAECDAMQWIEMVGLKDFANHYPKQLSGGMKQRVAIARALANRPRMLLMDEPFGALDAQTRCQMQSYLLQIWRNVELTVLFVTHDLDEAVYLADRIVVLGRNPGHVKEIIEVPVSRPRDASQFLSPEFLAVKQRLEELIHPPEEQQAEDTALPVHRMTVVGDEVW